MTVGTIPPSKCRRFAEGEIVNRSKMIHVAILKIAAAVHNGAMMEWADKVEIEYRVKKIVVLVAKSRVIEPRRRRMYLEGRKDMTLKE